MRGYRARTWRGMRIAGGRTDRQAEAVLFLFASRGQIYFICNEQMAPKQRTEKALPTHAMHTADINGEAL